MTQCLDMFGDHWSRRQHHAFSLLRSGISQRWALHLGPCETGLHIFAATLNAESWGSLQMHAWVSHTSADTHRCPLQQEPLDLPPCVFQVQTLLHKLQRLERLVFVRSLLYLHSCPKRARCPSLCGFEALTLQKWFQTITSLIRRDAFSDNISLPSFHRNWSLIGREKLHCWYWKTEAMAMSVNFGIKVHWLRPVSGQGSFFASGSQALQINGATALLLKADTCWDKWHWG